MLLKVEQLVIGHHQALTPPISFELASQQSLSLHGPNGVGKSTLVKALAGLMTPIRGKFCWQKATKLSWLPQELEVDPLFPLSVADFLKMGQALKSKKDQKNWQDYRSTYWELLKLEEIQDALFHELSGGQKQGCGLARALASQPDVLLLDEPFNHLDPQRTEQILQLLQDLQKNLKLSFILIDHSVERMASLTDCHLDLDKDQVSFHHSLQHHRLTNRQNKNQEESQE